MSPSEFVSWFNSFLPRIDLEPTYVSDPSDGKLGHLIGLNLSRAWCFRALAQALPQSDDRRPVMHAAADAHLAASLPHLETDYMGAHWLATFALLALEA